MFEKIKTKLVQLLQDTRDSWAPDLPATTPGQGENADRHNATPLRPHHAQPNAPDMRERLIRDECAEEILSRNSQRVHIVKSSEEIISSEVKRSFTEEGMVTNTDEYLLHTSDGRFIKGRELHRGGKCTACLGYSDRIYHCNVCRRPVCFTHHIPWKGVKVCPQCYGKLKFSEDTWESGQGRGPV